VELVVQVVLFREIEVSKRGVCCRKCRKSRSIEERRKISEFTAKMTVEIIRLDKVEFHVTGADESGVFGGK